MGKQMWKNKLIAGFLITGMVVSFAGCGSSKTQKASSSEVTSESSEKSSEAKADVVKLKVGVNISVAGLNAYLDDDENLAGSDIELLKAIDEMLDDIEFEYVPTSFDDVFVGLQSGSYQVGIANCFLTQERIDTYLIPEENIGASNVGLLLNKENGDLDSFEKVAEVQKEKGITFYPMQSGNGLTYPVEVYNEKNPDNQIKFDYTSENTNADVLGWIPTGKYDVGLALKSSWESNFQAEEGTYHEYYDKMTWNPVQVVGTYPLFNKSEVTEDTVKKISGALASLKDDGTATEISNKYFGYDVFAQKVENLAGN
jgi:L-cystine transport system substrate-binding protein